MTPAPTSPRHADLPATTETRFPSRYLLHPLRPVARAVVRSRYDVRLHDREHVPTEGPVIFAANHIGVLDGPLLAVFAPRPVHALTKAEMFESRFWGPFLKASGQISLDRFATDPAAVKQSVRVLRDGGAVGIFPEGARGPGDLGRFHRGAAYLSLVTGAPIVPVIMFGTRVAEGHTGSVPPRGARIDMCFRAPFTSGMRPWPRRREIVGRVSDDLRQRMLDDLYQASATTGRTLPGPLPAGERERDPGGGVTEQSA